jgi:hypothetical protein
MSNEIVKKAIINYFKVTGEDPETIFFEATFYSPYFDMELKGDFGLEKESKIVKNKKVVVCKRFYSEEELKRDENSKNFEVYEQYDTLVPYEELLVNFGLKTEGFSSDSNQDCFIMELALLKVDFRQEYMLNYYN